MLILSVLMSGCGPKSATTESAPPPPVSESRREAPIPVAEPAPSSPQSSPRDGTDLPDLGIPYTHDVMNKYRAVRHRIWSSSLGLLFQTFLSVPQSDRADVVRLSNAITERIFAKSGEELVRIAALQVMVEDLYENGRFTPELSYRLAVLEGDVAHKQSLYTAIPVQKLLDQAPAFMVFSFFAGSRFFMAQLKGLFGSIARAVLDLVREGRLDSFLRIGSGLEVRRLFSRSFFEGYSPAQAVRGFTNTFGPYSFTYLYLYRGRLVEKEIGGEGKIIMYGLEHLLEMEEL